MMKWLSETTGQFTKMYIFVLAHTRYDAFAVIEYMMYSAQKVSVFGVILVRIQSKCVKMKTRITPNTSTFHAVVITFTEDQRLQYPYHIYL